MMSYLFYILCFGFLLVAPAYAGEPLQPRVETHFRGGNERSLVMTEFWVPLSQNASATKVLYGDFRIMGDNHENQEGNLGLGYREMMHMPYLGEGVAGVHGWIDRRKTQNNSTFYQSVLGLEWLAKEVDLRLNGYVPLSGERTFFRDSSAASGSTLVGTGLQIDTLDRVLEEPQYGADLEVGFELGEHFSLFKNHTDAFRVFAGGYYFDADDTREVSGVRARLAADVSHNVQFGASFQYDEARGSQGFLEATFRFPFDNKRSYRKLGVAARLDESPVRDIDIVTNEATVQAGGVTQLLNSTTGLAQEILHVDNTAAGGGDGSVENPFNSLADAQAAASAHTMIYVNRGDGTSTNQNAGITLGLQGQQLVGSGTALSFDSSVFSTANGAVPSSFEMVAAQSAPVISNGAGDGVTITADDVLVSGITVDSANADGINVSNADDLTIRGVTLSNNGNRGIFYEVNDNVDGYNLLIDNAAMNGNTNQGIRMSVNGDANITVSNSQSQNNGQSGIRTSYTSDAVVQTTLSNYTSDNDSDRSIWILATDTVQATTVMDNVTVLNNTGGSGRGVQVQANTNSTATTKVSNSRFEGNTVGFAAFGINDGTFNLEISDSQFLSNTGDGIQHTASNNGTVTSKIQSSTITGNGDDGISYTDSSTNGITADIGGGAFGSTGQNIIHSNAGFDLRVDLDGGELKAENNWWGTAAGLQPGDVTLPNGTVDSDPFLTSAP